MKHCRLLAISTLLLTTSFGCAIKENTEYLDKPAPPSSAIPPPSPTMVMPVEKPLERFVTVDEAIKAEEMAKGNAEVDLSQNIQKFSTVYKAKNRPRIAIFLNRTLSDEVREWKTAERQVKSGDGSMTTVTSDIFGNRRTTELKREFATYRQMHSEGDGERVNPDERYVWIFEDSFVDPFLNAGTVLIDRATIMRLVVARGDNRVVPTIRLP